jgi:hypothetical protein
MPDDEFQMIFGSREVGSMPSEHPFREDCMKAGSRPVPPGSRCCWYHTVDWFLAIAYAATKADLVTQGGVDMIFELERPRDMRMDDFNGALSLFVHPIETMNYDDGFVDGQHRTRAMRDQGVVVMLTSTTVAL